MASDRDDGEDRPVDRPARAGAVRAAGGVVIRASSDGPEVLLVHRPMYDDWTFPKGKARPGEADRETALREVEEETGLRCRVGRDLGTTTYLDRHGRDKTVRYWEMHPVAETPRPADDEVDRIEWLALGDAAGRLTYRRDRAILRSVDPAQSTNL